MRLDPSIPGMPDQFDTGPLSWVMEEIRASLARASMLAVSMPSQSAEAGPTVLRQAGVVLHQVHGALQIVDVAGAPLLIEAMEDLLARGANGALTLEHQHLAAISTACQALTAYLDELLGGVAPQALSLYPYYRDLQQARGIARVHPSDLYFPDLSIRPRLPALPANAAVCDVGLLRQRFEKALLPFLKSTDPQAERVSATLLAGVLAELSSGTPGQQGRAYWWVLHGFAAGVASGDIAAGVYVKQLFGRINMQLRKFDELPSEASERVQRDALFFIASVEQPSPQLQQIRLVYGLAPVTLDGLETGRYGLIDARATAHAREALHAAKADWDRIAAGELQAVPDFQREVEAFAAAIQCLRSQALAGLLHQLAQIPRNIGVAAPGQALALEVASSLLFLENTLRPGTPASDIDETAVVLSARLNAVTAGMPAAGPAAWLDRMSREAQQRETVAALAVEMRGNLAQVEKMLDEFFSNSDKRTTLAPVDGILHQVEGGLAILDYQDALQAVRRVRAEVTAFAAPEFEGQPGRPEFQHVARNLGALSFFLESLQSHDEAAKSRFVFDTSTGLFHSRSIQRGLDREVDVPLLASLSSGPTAPAAPSVPAVHAAPAETPLTPPAAASASMPQLEAVIAPSVPLEPVAADPQLSAPGSAAEALAASDASTGQDQPGLEASSPAPVPDLSPTHEEERLPADSQLPDQAESMAPAASPLEPAALMLAENDDAVDAELLEIFLGEAVEVLLSIGDTLPLLRAAPHHQEYLTTLRRAFHTLKGSGRMVGLNAFGEAAWGLEKTLNLALADGGPASADLCDLMDRARAELSAWVEDLQGHGKSSRSPDALLYAAEQVREGAPLPAEGTLGSEPILPVAQPSTPLQAFAPAADLLPDAEQPQELEVELDGVGVYALPESQAEALSDELAEALPAVAGEETAAGLDAAQMADARATAAEPDADARPAPAELEFELEPATQAVSDVPTTLEEDVPAESLPLAQVIEFPDLHPSENRIDDNIKRIGDLEISVPLHNIYLAETDELVRVLAQDLAEWRHEAERSVNTVAVHAAHSLAGSSATVGFIPLQEVAYALERVLQTLARKPVPLMPVEFDALDLAVEHLKAMLQRFALGEMPASVPQQVVILGRIRQDVIDRAGSSAPEVHSAVPAFVPEQADEAQAEEADVPGAQMRPLVGFASRARSGDGHAPAFDGDIAAESAAEASRMPRDELDPDLLPVFLEEATDLLPQMQELLRTWQAEPGSQDAVHGLLRLLHTVKGSARMAGAMRLGQQMHDMESRIQQISIAGAPSAATFEDLLSRFDTGLYLYDQLQRPDAIRLASPVVNGNVASPAEPEPSQARGVSTVNAPLVRVRADILDRLVNQAGEVSISRMRVENGVSGLQQSLSELTENIVRLRGQLRELEIQAESQMASQMAQSVDRSFDPLEFDRFTRLHELTRMITETVSDVSSVQQNMQRGVEQAGNDLLLQSRLTRDLQQDLMRVRMVQFGSIAERLYRVTRQTAKELDKRVNLDIRGGSVEIDRSVLEKMAGPFEHLLRNAIVHGIESRSQRLAAGKKEIGELTVEIRQEGNEVVIQFSDDGQGLDLDRIRDKAQAVGLLRDDAKLSEAELRDLIFHPGFSTAHELTELAGRGIGMDIVRSEAAGLGGRVSIDSERGRGASFLVRLPLTLAVTQVVLLTTGGNTYAVPSVLVEQVQQLKAGALAAAYADGAVPWQGERVPLYYLSELLGDADAAPVTQQYSPLLILKSGDHRLAVHVDEVVGNREVVVKNIGPQLARMIGVAGATVLGSGDIVLILDPVPLAQRMTGAAPQTLSGDAPAGLEPPQVSHAPRSQPIVMVVDDSLTVRRVTQRFLTREGYQVMLAKDGVDALEQLQTVTPDVMLVDIEMPRMDGFDLTRNVRSDSRTRHVPIIMITSRTATKHRNYAMELGVNEYLGKPYQEADLLKFVSSFTGRDASAISEG
jgi:chemosensory pili system protein ChpA (sensor histidine kinase/response regulator)